MATKSNGGIRIEAYARRRRRKERKRICNKLRKLPASHWQRRIDLYMDNKKWDIATTARGKRFLNTDKVRGHLRERSEGLQKGFTKPNAKKHKVNTGGRVNVRWHHWREGENLALFVVALEW